MSTIVGTEPFTVTKEFVAAVKSAYTIYLAAEFERFKHSSTCQLRLRRRDDEETEDGWKLEYAERNVEFRSEIHRYDTGYESLYEDTRFRCSHLAYLYEGTSTRSAFEMLRPGDKPIIGWTIGNNNQYLKDAGLFHDQVRLIIPRKAKRLELVLDSCICPNNSARMFQLR